MCKEGRLRICRVQMMITGRKEGGGDLLERGVEDAEKGRKGMKREAEEDRKRKKKKRVKIQDKIMGRGMRDSKAAR